VFLVTDVLFGLLATSIVSGVIGGLLLWCWYGLPLVRMLRDGRRGHDALILQGGGS
jgi:hypothetical protein